LFGGKGEAGRIEAWTNRHETWRVLCRKEEHIDEERQSADASTIWQKLITGEKS